MCATKTNYLTMEDICSVLICQSALANILNVYQRFIKSPPQPKKTRGLVGQFPNRQKVNKEVYDNIDDFLHKLKEYLGESITTR